MVDRRLGTRRGPRASIIFGPLRGAFFSFLHRGGYMLRLHESEAIQYFCYYCLALENS